MAFVQDSQGWVEATWTPLLSLGLCQCDLIRGTIRRHDEIIYYFILIQEGAFSHHATNDADAIGLNRRSISWQRVTRVTNVLTDIDHPPFNLFRAKYEAIFWLPRQIAF
jgi:hypothetical protein